MKKLIIITISLTIFTIISTIILSTPKRILYLLNWGEYISYDVVKDFEEMYDCQVVEEIVTSSEAMYQKIQSQTTSYDVAIPGDYCVRQLYNENLLKELDTSNTSLDNLYNHDTIFNDSLKYLMDKFMVNSNNDKIDSYYMPYLWGAYTIIYSKNNKEVEDVITTYGFEALYNRSLYKSNVKIGMYDTARWMVVSYLLANKQNPNITRYELDEYNKAITIGDLSKDIQDDVVNAMKKVNFNEIGNDSMKRNVANGTLDLCFTQLGDFFDALYLLYEGGNTEISINVFVPENTCAFFDSMIIPVTCHDYDLANKFIDFMLEPTNAYNNACAIGYSPTLKSVADLYLENALNGEYYFEDVLTLTNFLNNYPMYLNPLYNSDINNVYLLEPKDNTYLTTCETIKNKLS